MVLFRQLVKALLKSNYALIAENTTKYYLELTRNYRNRFDDEVTLLTTAGVLDAQTYVFSEGSIGLDTISYIAKQAVSKEELEPTSYQKMTSQAFLKKFRTKSAIDKIVSSSEEKDELEKDTLFNFIFSLEVEIFVVDSPEFNRSAIELACYGKADTILKAINRMKKRYKGEKLFTLATTNLMSSPKFEAIRKQLGIKAKAFA
ncbi:hypothetical protein ACFLYC_01615 [Chloroflexota bacterium]